MKINYRPDIDGLRAVAVSAVVLFHYNIPYFQNGYLGVDVFFVISGFLITSIIYNEISAGNFTYKKFYARRFRRILPALIVVVAVTTLLACFILPPFELKRYAVTAIAALAGLSNFAFYQFVDYFSPTADKQLLLMTWSLGVEEQFYLLFPPLLVFIISRRKSFVLPVLALIVVLSFVMAVGMNAYRPDAAFYLIPFRAWELGAGALLAVSAAGRWSERLSAVQTEVIGLLSVALIGSALFLDANVPIVVRNLCAVAGTVLLIMSGRSFTNRHVLASRLLVGIGIISYSWYLWHWLPASMIHLLEIKIGYVPRIALIFATLMLGIASYHFVEKPFRKPSSNDTTTILKYAAAVCLTISPLCILVATSGLSAYTYPPVRDIEAEIRGSFGNPCLASYGVSTPRVTPPCMTAASNAAVALIGDSHANALADGIKDFAASRSSDFYQFTKSSCPPLNGYTRYMSNRKGHDKECSMYMSAVFEILDAHPEVNVVIVAGYWAASFDEEYLGFRYVPSGSDGSFVSAEDSRRNLEQGLNQTITSLQKPGRKIILVQDVPRFDVDPYTGMLAQLIPLRGWLTSIATAPITSLEDPNRISMSRVKQDTARNIVNNVFEKHPEVQILDPFAGMCNQLGCVFKKDNLVYYGDSQHLSKSGAKYLSRYLTN